VTAYGDEKYGKEWRSRFDDNAVKGMTLLCLWRPVHMKHPVVHQPLSVCDPRTISMDDLVPTSVLGFTVTGQGTSQLCLRYNSGHKWFYFPEMTVDETLVMKQFEYFKDGASD